MPLFQGHQLVRYLLQFLAAAEILADTAVERGADLLGMVARPLHRFEPQERLDGALDTLHSGPRGFLR